MDVQHRGMELQVKKKKRKEKKTTEIEAEIK